MFEVGFTEILLIFGIALLVLGPEKLPKLAADVGRWAGRARSMARQLRTQLEQETQFNPLAGVDTNLSSGAPVSSPNLIHPPPPSAPVTAADDASRAAPAQLADQAPVPAAAAFPAPGADGPSVETAPSVPDTSPLAGQDGR